MTPCTISDMIISQNEKWVIISSAKGTSHVYKINPMKSSSEQKVADYVIKRKESITTEEL